MVQIYRNIKRRMKEMKTTELTKEDTKMETMSVTQALRITVDNLGAIAVPRALNQQIGIPIDQAISNLIACIEALEKAKDGDDPESAETEEENGDSNAE